jgi:radical SAM superfamily enzyme YgiQ (UPF0313 family)
MPRPVKELILINPLCGNVFVRYLYSLLFGFVIPQGLYTLAALTPPGYNIRIFSYKWFWGRRDFPAGALVGITCISSNVRAAYQLALRYRRAGAFVVMGGSHVSCLPDEALEYCDSVVVGEAESVWKELVSDFERGVLKKKYVGQPLDDFFTPAFDYFMRLPPLELFSAGIQTTRGCKYHCEFCAHPFVKYRNVKLHQVLDLIRRVKPIARYFPVYFRDDNVYSNPKYAKALFKALIPLRIRWASAASLDIAFDEEALQLAKDSGCVLLFIGFETIYPEQFVKTSLGQKVRTSADLLAAIRKVQSYGISVRGAFILGFDDYGHADYWKLLWFIIRARLHFAAASILTPFPGTKLRERLKKEGRIITDDWNKYDATQVVIRPARMSPAALAGWFIVMRICFLFASTQFWPLIFSIMAIEVLVRVFL